jgi:hypothetical protein
VHREDENRIVDTIIKFFIESDISIARDVLLEHASSIGITLPRLPARRSVGDGRRNRELKDIFQIISTLDTAKSLDKLPVFASNDPSEMPSINLTEGDLRSIMLRLDQLDSKLEAIASTQVAIFDSQQRINKPGQSRDRRSLVKTTGAPDDGTLTNSSRMAGHVSADKSALAIPSYSNVNNNANLSRLNDVSVESIRHPVSDNYGTTEDYIDSEPFQLSSAARKKLRNKRRRVQSKNSSPVIDVIDLNDALMPGAASVVAVAIAKPSYSAVASRQVNKPAMKNRSQLLIGRKSTNILHNQQDCTVKIIAAKPYLGKSVFCIDNVAAEVEAVDMCQFVSSIGVKVLTCNKVPPRRSLWQRQRGIIPIDRSTFRLCISKADTDKLLNADIWPENIAISRWIFSKNARPPTVDEPTVDETGKINDIDQQLQKIRSMSNSNTNYKSDSGFSHVFPTIVVLENSLNHVVNQPATNDISESASQGMDTNFNDIENGEQ